MQKILLLVLAINFSFQSIAQDYKVTDFGAIPDGVTLNTAIIQGAIDYVTANGGGRLVFTAGNYLSGSIYLKSNVILHLENDAVLLGSTTAFDYIKDPYIGWMSLVFALKQQNIGITGNGTIDGRGFHTATNMVDNIHKGIFTDPLRQNRPNETNRPQNVYFRECDNIVIKGILLKDPASWNQTYDQCVNLVVDSIRVDSKNYWNNDGIDIVDCKNVVITNSYFDAADDAICFKSHDAKKICEDVVVDNCIARSSANGVKFGTVSAGGFRNFSITNITVFDTYRSAITFAAVDGGIVENILVDGVKSTNTGNVIYLRIGDRWSGGRKPAMKDIVIKNVYAEVPAGKADAGYLYEGPVEDLPRNVSPSGIVGLPEYKIKNVTLENIKIIYPGGANPYYAYRGVSKAALDSIPELPAAYPEFSQFKELPAWGFYLRHAENVTFKNVTLVAANKEYRPAIVSDDVKNIFFENLKTEEPDSKKKKQIILHKSTTRKK